MINIEGYTKKLQHYSIENIRKEMRHRNMEKKKIMHHMTIGFSNILTKDIVKQIFDYTQIKIPACFETRVLKRSFSYEELEEILA